MAIKLSFFEKVTGIAKDQIKLQKDRSDKEKALKNLDKNQLMELAIDFGISISKNDSVENIIDLSRYCV